MQWVLVFINVIYNANAGYNEPMIESWYEYDTMEECFLAREALLLDLGIDTGYYPINTQAVCVRAFK